MILAGLLTVGLLLLVVVTVWKCWNLPPVPLQRWWSVGFGAVILAWLAAHLRAELWKKRYRELEESIHTRKSVSLSRRLLLPKAGFASRFCTRPCAVSRFDLLFSGLGFQRVLTPFDVCMYPRICGQAGLPVTRLNLHNTAPIALSSGFEAWLVQLHQQSESNPLCLIPYQPDLMLATVRIGSILKACPNPNVMRVERLYDKSSTLPILSQLKAKRGRKGVSPHY